MDVLPALAPIAAGAALVLYFAGRLVDAARGTARALGVSSFFVAVIALGSIIGAAMVAIVLALGITVLLAPLEFEEAPKRILALTSDEASPFRGGDSGIRQRGRVNRHGTFGVVRAGNAARQQNVLTDRFSQSGEHLLRRGDRIGRSRSRYSKDEAFPTLLEPSRDPYLGSPRGESLVTDRAPHVCDRDLVGRVQTDHDQALLEAHVGSRHTGKFFHGHAHGVGADASVHAIDLLPHLAELCLRVGGEQGAPQEYRDQCPNHDLSFHSCCMTLTART
jgi:hypothetical protein